VEMPNASNPSRPFVIGIAAFVVLGLTDGAIGTIWPDLRNEFGKTDGSFGQIFAALAGGYLVASAYSGHLSDRAGVPAIIRIGATGSAIGLGVIALGPSWSITLAGFAILGLGNGLSDSVLNAWVALNRGPRAMGLLHALYGVGALGGPLVATGLTVNGQQWRTPFAIFALVQFVVVAAVFVRAQDFDQTAPIRRETSVDRESAHPWLLGSLLTWFLIYVGLEVSVGQWSFTMLTEARSMSDINAAILVSSFWGGVTLGRLGLAVVGHSITPERLMAWASLLAVVAVTTFAANPWGLGGGALPVIGLSLSVMFPMAVNRTPHYLGTARASKVVGYQLATSSAGAIAVPALVGLLADRHGTEVLGPVLVIGSILLAALWFSVSLRLRPQ